MTSDEQAIRNIVALWHSATAAGDVDTVLGLMADDDVCLPCSRSTADERPQLIRARSSRSPYRASHRIGARPKQAVPHLRSLVAFSNTDHPGEKSELRATETAAQTLGIDLIYIAFSQSPFGASPELDKALGTVRRAQPDAMVVFPEGATMANRARLANFAIAQRLPSMFGWSEYAEAGGLMSYGASQRDAHARLASYADKILKGAKPGDLPIEQPTKFEVVINLKTAKALSLTIAPSLLLQADKVIE